MKDEAKRMERALRDGGVRITRQRKAVLKALAEAEDHPDAEALHARAREHDEALSLSTVYRTLTTLEAQGAIERHAFDGAAARYETVSEHHDHIIDVDTGEVTEFRSDKIERLQAEIAAELGYDLVHHRLELYGRKRARKR